MSDEPRVPANFDAVKKVNEWIIRAVSMGASDIHIEPRAKCLRVRVRVDGGLKQLDEVPAAATIAVVARLKIMAGLDVNERRTPQDGRINFGEHSKRVAGLDLRVSVNPTLFGEKVVMRLVDNTKLAFTLADMGFSEGNLERYRRCIHAPHGLVLHVGPTGSGKTTTLYAALEEVNAPDINLCTVEDPIEYTRDGYSQTQVNTEVGLTFPSILRALLRQDPDVIMIGEIRDLETAEIAIEGAMTGHLIFSTLHTNDAIGTIARLQDMGIAPYYIAYALLCVVSQRFVRKLCVCKVEEDVPRDLIATLDLPPGRYCRPQGCGRCDDQGYQGRVAVMEVLTVDDGLRAAIYRKAVADELKVAAQRAGMRSLLQDGIEKAAAGLTSLAEVLRVTQGIAAKDDDSGAGLASVLRSQPAIVGHAAAPQPQVAPHSIAPQVAPHSIAPHSIAPHPPAAQPAAGPRRVVVRRPGATDGEARG